MVTGFQDYWIAGTRFYYRRDPIASVEQPLVDLGIIKTATPSITPTAVELYDPDGGVKSLADRRTTQIKESYDVTCANLSLQNLALAFMANPPTSFSQSAAEVTVTHWATPDGLIKLKDANAAFVYGLAAIGGVYSTGATIATLTVTAITVASTGSVFEVSSDPTAIAGLAHGKAFILNRLGLANVANSRTYTVAARSATTITTVEVASTAETAITGQLSYATAGTIYLQGADFLPYSKDRGIVKIVSGGAIAAAANVSIVYSTGALSGLRLINPQTLGDTTGDGFFLFSRTKFAEETVREFRCQISPNAFNLADGDFADMVLTVSVLSDLTAAVPAGRLLHHKGTVPTRA